MQRVLDPQLSAAIAAARASQVASRALRRGGGSTIPGVVARRVDPGVLTKLSRRLDLGSAAVTGTNGKTTTTRMVAKILQSSGLRFVNNATGANLVTGVTAALVADAKLSGFPRSEVGLFEVDEASVPKVAAEAELSLLAVLNLFRDQLDRYGELSYTAKVIASAFDDLPAGGRVVLNADDPLVASLGRQTLNPLFFGVDAPALDTGTLQHVADSKDCPVCGTPLRYDAVYFGHVGTYRCPNCGFARPEPAYAASNVRLDPGGTDFLLHTPAGDFEARLALPGLYNLYNALAAAAVSMQMGVSGAHAVEGLRNFGGAFGRVERVRAGEKEVFLLLIKNPVGFNEILRTFVAGGETSAEANGATTAKNILIAINDNDADGRDVSWLWDVDFEMLAGTNAFYTTTGIRAHDMAVRLKYADLPVHSVVPDRKVALTAALDRTPPGETLYVLPTYTAMLELRKTLADLGHTHPFWEDR